MFFYLILLRKREIEELKNIFIKFHGGLAFASAWRVFIRENVLTFRQTDSYTENWVTET